MAVARRRLRDRYLTSVDPEHVLVIGDTPNDVATALTAGTQLIAVATGNYGIEELAGSGADVTLADLADSDQLDVAFTQAGLTRE